VWLIATVILVAVASKYIRIPYTIALTIAGLIIALTGIKLEVNLTPDLILFIFLPALLFESSYNLPFAEVRDNLRPIVLLAVPGVILTALCVAAGLYFTTGIGWDTAFLFGAIMSATDPVSVLAIFRSIGAPKRLSVVLEGESLFNDGTSIVLFRIVLSIVLAGTVGNVFSTIGQFLIVVLGAVAMGAIIGFAASALLSRVNDYLVETSITLIVAYGTYLMAEQVGVSGVIAVVVAALVLGNYGRVASMSPSTRLAVSSTWEFFGFLANSLIFLLIGLELNIANLSQYWVPTLVAISIVLLVRVVVVAVSSGLLRYIHRPIPSRWQAVLVWGGLRGSLALALALSIPITSGVGVLFPNRDLILVMTFGVILFSLLVQGLTMQPLLARLGLIDRRDRQDEYETIAARKGMLAAALNEVERMNRVGSLSAAGAKELRGQYASQIEELDENMRELRLQDEDLRHTQERSIRRHLLQIEKNAVRQRNLDGTISDEPMRRLLAEIDEEMHLLDEAE
jgi:monovalent cation:H+ antiporter, CPA1 family